MKSIKNFLLILALLAVPVHANDWKTTGKGGSDGKLAPEVIEKAWADFPKFTPGSDAGPMLTLEWAVINSMNDPAARKTVAARLAALLKDPNTTIDAKKFICAKLYRIGTEAEVSAVTPLLADPLLVDDSRLFLERIGSEEARKALRDAAAKLQGRALIGVLNSLSILQDAPSAKIIIEQTNSSDKEVARAAWRAIGNYGCEEVGKFLFTKLQEVKEPHVQLESAAIRTALLLKETKPALAEAILDQLTFSYRSYGARSAGWQNRWNDMPSGLQKELAPEWFKSSDPVKRRIAGSIIYPQIEKKIAEKTYADWFKELMSDSVQESRAAHVYFAAQPKDPLGNFMLQELKKMKVPSLKVMDVLAAAKCYGTIDALIEMAAKPDPAIYEPVLYGLRGICDPDEIDLSRMFKLYLRVEDEAQKDLVSRTTAAIAEKNPNPAQRADILLKLVNSDSRKNSPEFTAEVLPLLGRLGTPAVFQMADAARKSENPKLQAAGWQALCNWPTAEHAGLLWEKANAGDAFALRAFMRVTTIPSDRPAVEVLADLKRAFEKADSPENRQLALERAKAVRCIETVEWLKGFLDDEVLAQTACASIVELAHHRFLRQPNKEFFEPILQKVKAVAKDPVIQQKAEKARMGM